MTGIKSILGVTLREEDNDEYHTDLMSVINRHSSPQFLKGINDVYREIERFGGFPDDSTEEADMGDDSADSMDASDAE